MAGRGESVRRANAQQNSPQDFEQQPRSRAKDSGLQPGLCAGAFQLLY